MLQVIGVIGVDPSLRATGLCLPTGECFTIATGEANLGDIRLLDLRRQLVYYVQSSLGRGRVPLAVIEVPAQFQSGDAALAAGMAQGICREVFVESGIPIAKVNLSKVKMFATGHGDASKPQMILAANYYRARLEAGPNYRDLTDDNQADAWWLREMGLWHLGVRRIDGSGDDILNGHIVRDGAVAASKGVKWPGAGEPSAVLSRPGHPVRRKTG
jgi:Holliday junction resolvasome RuvABC endonuclease subunit